MKTLKFQQDNIYLANVATTVEIQKTVADIFCLNEDLLPQNKNALALLKPNLNNDLNALMGNSTDLRLLVAVIKALKERGFNNIVIAEGSNIGMWRREINAFSRLKIDKIAKMFDVKLLDLNNAPHVEIELANGVKAKAAQICFEADLFINLPKIKTHAEATLSICLKNMMGTLVGGLEKRKMHGDLSANIVKLNKQLKPHFHIVDGLIAMEGNGPGDGKPRKVGLILAGRDGFLLDALCARLMGFELKAVPYLKVAKECGLFRQADLAALQGQQPFVCLEKPPARKVTARLLGHDFFMGLRNLVRPLFDNQPIMKILYRLRIVQDVYNQQDAVIERISLDRQRCNNCNRCIDYCPLNLSVKSAGFSADNGCIGCLYCAFVCPQQAINFKGDLGYLAFYLNRYSDYMQRLS